jgi:hypothetical protein
MVVPRIYEVGGTLSFGLHGMCDSRQVLGFKGNVLCRM